MSYLRFSSLELVQKGLSLRPNVKFGVVIHQKYQIRMVNEPLAGLVEIVEPVNFPLGSGFQHPRDLSKSGLLRIEKDQRSNFWREVEEKQLLIFYLQNDKPY